MIIKIHINLVVLLFLISNIAFGITTGQIKVGNITDEAVKEKIVTEYNRILDIVTDVDESKEDQKLKKQLVLRRMRNVVEDIMKDKDQPLEKFYTQLLASSRMANKFLNTEIDLKGLATHIQMNIKNENKWRPIVVCSGQEEDELSKLYDVPLIVTNYPKIVKAFYMKEDEENYG